MIIRKPSAGKKTNRQEQIARQFFLAKGAASQAYFVYSKKLQRIDKENWPQGAADAFVFCRSQIKKGAGRTNHSPRTDSRFAMSCLITHRATLKQTGPCGPWHGGGQEPYGRWK